MLKETDVRLLTIRICFLKTGYAFGFAGQNTPPVFDFKREWLVPESEPIGKNAAIRE